MRRLFAVLFFQLLLLAIAANSGYGQSNGTSSTPFKLFAGVSHKEVLPEAPVAIKPHLDKQEAALNAAVAASLLKEVKSAAHPAALSIHSKTASSVNLQAGTAKAAAVNAVSKPTQLTANATANQSYIPAFGVARTTTERTPDPPRPAHHYTVEWFMIPAWMAGTWSKEGDLTTSVADFQTGVTSAEKEWTPNKLQATWGHQQDAQGNYWHVNLTPFERDGMSEGKLVRFLCVEQRSEKYTPKELMTRTHYVVSENNPWNNAPTDTFQQEALNHYEQTGQNQLVNSNSTRVFTYQGAPVREGHLVSDYTRIGQYIQMASMNGIDLRASLNDYLDSHNLSHLKK